MAINKPGSNESASESLMTTKSVDELDAKILCPMCRAKIARGSKICINCKSDLTWKRFLPVGSTTLAMFTALVAVVATVAPQMKKVFEVPDSKLTAVMMGEGASDGTVSLLVSNDGNRVGAIDLAYVSVPYEAKTSTATASFSLRVAKEGMLFIKPNTSQQVKFIWVSGSETADKEEMRKVAKRNIVEFNLYLRSKEHPCTLSVIATNSHGDRSPMPETKFSCGRIDRRITDAIFAG